MVLAPSVPASMPVFEWIYGWKVLAMPRRVVLFQPTLEAWFTSWRMVAALGLMAVVAGVVATALRHPEATPAVRRSEERRRVMLWVALMVCLFPALTGWLSGRIPFDEQRQLAFIMPILGLLAWVVSRFWSLDLFRREAMVVGLGLAVVLFAISLARRDHFVNDNTFVSHWARNNPRVWETLARRAEAWAGAGRYSAAERQVERGLMLKPDEPGLLVVREAIEEKTGRLEAALVTLNSLSIAEPTNLVHQVKTADVQFKLGRYKEAGDLYEALLQTAPEDAGLKEKLEASRKAVQPPNS
jgi:hypothetical protein